MHQSVITETFGACATADSAPRAVIADDSTAFREALGQLLTARGVRVIGEAATGKAAVRLVDELRPDLAFVDLRMPGLNGIEACVAIRAKCSQVRLVLMSASLLGGAVDSSARFGVLSKLGMLEPDGIWGLLDRLMR